MQDIDGILVIHDYNQHVHETMHSYVTIPGGNNIPNPLLVLSRRTSTHPAVTP
ncbi:hypothetical protein KS4_12890 [Poriferisphaera corsica]|uniref:Uncharacterized protein n=1 Tax=Poriferisphaera corsica TaxID=2528020 RepID=A0A517YSQ1_9BACT|nr:hypothetical protein KS4_12890 [Poriferisphaera corsica]